MTRTATTQNCAMFHKRLSLNFENGLVQQNWKRCNSSPGAAAAASCCPGNQMYNETTILYELYNISQNIVTDVQFYLKPCTILMKCFSKCSKRFDIIVYQCVMFDIKFYNQCKTFLKELYIISKPFVQYLKTQLYRLYRLYELAGSYNIVRIVQHFIWIIDQYEFIV